MLTGFVGEFLVFSGTMQSSVATHTAWTVVATSGVILTASYMLWMIQRVFYGNLGMKPTAITGWDLDTREQLALWPLMILFLVMGVFSPVWTRAIDTAGTALAQPFGAAVHTVSLESRPAFPATTEGGQR
jgi:NADH-quinone oxidoreductase subunit M